MMQDEWIDIPSIEETPIPTMEIKNSGGSFADSMAPYLVRQESSGNPYAVSKAGAQGLWQIMPNTGREMASKLGMQNFDPFNPQHSETVGKAYLNQMYDQFQDPQLALAAYNAGPGRVQQAIQRAGTNDPSAVLQFLPSETQNYVPKILGNAQKESAYAAPNTQDEWIDIPSVEEQPAPQERPPYVPSANVSSQDLNNPYSNKGNSTIDNLNDWASYALDWIPLGKRAASGLKYLETGGDSKQAELMKEALDAGSKNYENNGSTLGKSAAILTASLPTMFLPAGMTSTLARTVGTGAGLTALDKLDDTTNLKDIGVSSLIGGATSGVAYPLVKILGKAGNAFLDSDLGQALANKAGQITDVLKRIPENIKKPVAEIASNESGNIKIPDIIKSDLPELSKAETVLLNKTKDIGVDNLTTALSKIRSGQENRIPVNLPEAVDSEGLYRLADVLANNNPTSSIYKERLTKINNAAPERIRNQLSNILNKAKDETGQEILPDDAIPYAAQQIKKTLEKTRSELADRVYDVARKARPEIDTPGPILDNPELNLLFNNKNMQEVLDSVKNKLDLESSIRNLKSGKSATPDKFNPKAFDSVDLLKRKLFELQKDAKKGVTKASADDYKQLREMLVKATDFPEYQTARAEYAKASKPINEILGKLDFDAGKETKGLLTDFIKMNEISKPAQAGDKLLSMRPEHIGRIREVFKNTDENLVDNIESGVASYLNNKIQKSGVTQTIKYIQSKGAEPLKKALGEEKYNTLNGLIDLERLVKKTYDKTAAGSPTQPRLQESKLLEDSLGFVNSIIGGNWKQKILKHFVDASTDGSDVVKMEIVDILTDPVKAQKFLDNASVYRSISEPRIKAIKNLVKNFQNEPLQVSIGVSDFLDGKE